MSDGSDGENQIHIDSDWKAEAQAEKDRLAAEAEKKKAAQSEAGGAGDGPEAGPGQLPPATFDTLIKITAQEALFALGAMPDPRTGQSFLNLDVARYHIDVLAMLEGKTKGNLTEEESKTLSTTIYELRQLYVTQGTSQRQASRT